jgi:hypothetical protein
MRPTIIAVATALLAGCAVEAYTPASGYYASDPYYYGPSYYRTYPRANVYVTPPPVVVTPHRSTVFARPPAYSPRVYAPPPRYHHHYDGRRRF